MGGWLVWRSIKKPQGMISTKYSRSATRCILGQLLLDGTFVSVSGIFIFIWDEHFLEACFIFYIFVVTGFS